VEGATLGKRSHTTIIAQAIFDSVATTRETCVTELHFRPTIRSEFKTIWEPEIPDFSIYASSRYF
jgi:hypothetical protein